IDISLHVFRKLHCFVTLRSSSHGLFAALGSGSPKLMIIPSGVVMLVTRLPVFSARLTSVAMLGLRWRRDDRFAAVAATASLLALVLSDGGAAFAAANAARTRVNSSPAAMAYSSAISASLGQKRAAAKQSVASSTSAR